MHSLSRQTDRASQHFGEESKDEGGKGKEMKRKERKTPGASDVFCIYITLFSSLSLPILTISHFLSLWQLFSSSKAFWMMFDTRKGPALLLGSDGDSRQHLSLFSSSFSSLYIHILGADYKRIIPCLCGSWKRFTQDGRNL